MRILHVITSLRTGGAERLITDMLPKLHKDSFDVELMIFDGTETQFLHQLSEAGIKIHVAGKGMWQMWNPLNIFKIKRIIKGGNFDVIHTHNTPAQILTAIAVKASSTLLITTEHNTTNRRRKWKWFRCIDRWMYGRYKHIVCVSEKTKENLLESSVGLSEKKLSVISNGIDFSRFNNDFSTELKRGDDTKIILMVAAFRKQKDQPTLIKALQHLPGNYVAWFAGEGVRLRNSEKLVKKLGLERRIRFLGDRKNLEELYKAANVVVLSSYYEGLSLSSIEGMASGKPFIASDVDGLREIVGGAGLLFPKGNDLKLAELIQSVCENGEYSGGVAKECMERALKFDISTTVNKYERLYQGFKSLT